MSNVISIDRPGIALGDYPERDDVQPCKWDKAASSLSNYWKSEKLEGLSASHNFVQKVLEGHELLTDLKDGELSEISNSLKQELRAKGQVADILIKVFALVREIAGRTLGMRHYESQLLGGWALAQGNLAEMETGEGKTLTATLPASAAALAGVPVHIITSNDYLVARDAEWMRPIYNMLGLTVGVITENSDMAERKKAYACDITYCTGKQVVFDYLRDRIIRTNANSKLKLQLDGLRGQQSLVNKLLLRGLCFAIVDEADSIFIDEARTPFILSKSNKNNEQNKICKQAFNIAEKLELDKHFIVFTAKRAIELTQAGKNFIEELSRDYGNLWRGVVRREELVRQALFSQYLLARDKDYLVCDGRIKIIDQNTGRLMPDRSWGQGLQQMVETKEGCELSGQNETLSRITYQEFFRKYLKLSGMTGTATEVKQELHSVYKLKILKIPCNKPNARIQLPTHVYGSIEEKWNAVIHAIRTMHNQQRPVLVGTCSVSDSEKLSNLMREKGLDHQVLNANQDKREAQIISQAGKLKQITIATNMAGRGTDIKLDEKAESLGGLHVILTQRNESFRVDRQLIGRCARQGDQGSYQTILSLEDDLIKVYYSRFSQYLIKSLPNNLIKQYGNKIILNAQRGIEKMHATMRKNVVQAEPNFKKMLAFTSLPK